MYFYLGPTPDDTTRQYTAAVGRHPLPPYWSLGFHLCRWGYDTIDNMVAAYNRTFEAGIPHDAQWGDIDVLERKLDFTYDSENFPTLPDFVDELHAKGRCTQTRAQKNATALTTMTKVITQIALFLFPMHLLIPGSLRPKIRQC